MRIKASRSYKNVCLQNTFLGTLQKKKLKKLIEQKCVSTFVHSLWKRTLFYNLWKKFDSASQFHIGVRALSTTSNTNQTIMKKGKASCNRTQYILISF
jgi:uncharacterized pyridoxal phosphate-containing UPF0001 family protein